MNFPGFGGVTYAPERDRKRLRKQLQKTFDLMKDGVYRTPPEMEQALGYPWASISARLRDFRKPKFGLHTVDRVYVGNGLWAYALTPNAQIVQPTLDSEAGKQMMDDGVFV